jgi:hypothetical protein
MLHACSLTLTVMAGLVPATHAFLSTPRQDKAWMAGTSPAMTKVECPYHLVSRAAIVRRNTP